jgi:molecular chaperone DnaK
MITHKSFGLDLGTTNSTASVVKNGKIIFAEEGRAKSKTIPSILAVRRNGEEVVGAVAKNEWVSGNPNSKKSIKREMGKQVTFEIGDEDLLPEEISAKVINYCKECLIHTLGNEKDVVYDKVVITVPAYFSLAQKDATRKAGELSGLEVQMLLEEPTAAAINYAIQKNVEDGVFFVFDLGGGTFDVSILEKTGNIPTVLAIAGNLYLGGDNFDYILARYFLDQLRDVGYDVNDVKVDDDDRKFRLLMFAAENVKKQLSVSDTYSIYFPDVFKDNSGIDLSIEDFTREQFNDLIKDKIETDIINECEKALKDLNEKSGKTLEDITHIIMVGGSTKIPYVQEVIKSKYCTTDKLKDVTIFEPDLSVSAGAGFIANSNGFTLEDEANGIVVSMNAPYIIDGQIYISGNLVKGNVTEIGVKDAKGEEKAPIVEGKFMLTAPSTRFTDNCTYTCYNGATNISAVENADNSTVDIIAPTPVQNEDIAIEIIDVEKGKIEKFPILASGTYLPSESTEYFKINEYSKEQVVLPVWEGPRKIFNFIIDLPKNVKIGSKLAVTTSVDLISNVTLDVEIEGVKLEGRYEYIEQKAIDEEQVENLEEIFEKRIEYVDDEVKRQDLIAKKADIDRELEEARSNNDENHYENVSQKYEKVVAEMPATPILTDEQFDQIGSYIKSKLTPDLKYSEFDIDNLCFYGKRFIKKGNTAEAQKCMDDLISIKGTVDLFNDPSTFYEMCKLSVMQILLRAAQYMENPRANKLIVDNVNREYNQAYAEIDELLKKYDDGHTSPEMKQDGQRLIQLTSGIFQAMQSVMPDDDAQVNAYRGLVSKA